VREVNKMAETQQVVKQPELVQALLRAIATIDETEMDKKSSISISAEFWQEKVGNIKGKYPELSKLPDSTIKGALKIVFKDYFMTAVDKLMA
jgi:hypothetical protein